MMSIAPIPPRAYAAGPFHASGRRAPAAPGPYPVPVLPPVAPVPPLALRLPAARPDARRPVQQRTGMRLSPLETFIWGSRHPQPQPRTRGDHVLIWVVGGTVQLDFPRQRQRLGPDELRFIPAGTAFASVPSDNAAGQVLLLAPDLARDCEPALPGRVVAGRIGAEGDGLSALLSDLALEGGRVGPQTASAVAGQLGLLSIRLQRLDSAAREAPGPAGTQPDLTLVERFAALAAQELGRGRTIGDMAADLGCSTAALDRACIAACGRRAVQLVHDLRHERAVEALRGTARPPYLIARDLGYSSLAHFNRAFVAATGCPPEAFRGFPGATAVP